MRRVTSPHFFMYLRQLNRHSPLLFALAIIFICGQLFVILIWGIVVTPFYNYGMYSEVMDVKKSYNIFEVELNGKRLRGQDFSPEQWDKIMLPLQFYADINKSNNLYETDIKRLFSKMHISSNESNFLSTCNYQQFEDWYKNYLQQITHQKTQSLSVNYRTYLYRSDTLHATDQFLPLSKLCN